MFLIQENGESLTFMILVISVLMLYAPRLFRLSRKFGHITPADYAFHRFGSHPIRILTVLLLSWGLANYICDAAGIPDWIYRTQQVPRPRSPGVWGLAANYAICVAGTLLAPAR